MKRKTLARGLATFLSICMIAAMIPDAVSAAAISEATEQTEKDRGGWQPGPGDGWDDDIDDPGDGDDWDEDWDEDIDDPEEEDDWDEDDDQNIQTEDQDEEEIIEVSSIAVKEGKKLTLAVGKKKTLHAVIRPTDATDSSVEWFTSRKSIVTVTDEGVITGIKAGTATITAAASNGLEATCKVTVGVPATKVKITNGSKVTVTKGKTVTLKTTVTPKTTTDTITWSTSKKSVATVTSKGVVKGIRAGRAVITATATSGKKATCIVTVKSNVTKVELNLSSVSIKKGKTVKLKASVTPVSTSKITWTTSNKRVATVSKRGLVKGVKRGTAIIKATLAKGKSDSCKVKVK